MSVSRVRHAGYANKKVTLPKLVCVVDFVGARDRLPDVSIFEVQWISLHLIKIKDNATENANFKPCGSKVLFILIKITWNDGMQRSLLKGNICEKDCT